MQIYSGEASYIYFIIMMIISSFNIHYPIYLIVSLYVYLFFSFLFSFLFIVVVIFIFCFSFIAVKTTAVISYQKYYR